MQLSSIIKKVQSVSIVAYGCELTIRPTTNGYALELRHAVNLPAIATLNGAETVANVREFLADKMTYDGVSFMVNTLVSYMKEVSRYE